MKLVQKLPIALSLACAMMLSSCSKEDTLAPQPMAGSVNEHSGAKTNAGEEGAAPYFASTFGVTGFEKYPMDWIKTTGPGESIPAGSSSLTSLWGIVNWSPLVNPKWVKPLPAVPGIPAANTVVTVKSFAHTAAESSDKSSVFTWLKNLKPGKTYVVTFYVASTIVNGLGSNGERSVYATSAEIKILNVNGGSNTTNIGFYGQEATWVKKTITFKANADQAKFSFSGLTPLGNVYSYIHLFVDRNSIRELNAFQPMVVQ
ncbi:hypothetical protein [Dyadobacter aurulentus]|uniref:hypothetical protein n=1 Tax=Dyadobacter sp. UC 10 TaxID=2605428 RepID=UPI0011F15BB0|nr:hypothetical protein [Dyadobacter sp. UC 10]KAA0990860.1 hypothetical protein FXO21_12200 [Dyadobacter sp. UC 10]